MTRAVGEDTEMLSSLDEVAVLFDQAQTSVFKLMASVCFPISPLSLHPATHNRNRTLCPSSQETQSTLQYFVTVTWNTFLPRSPDRQCHKTELSVEGVVAS